MISVFVKICNFEKTCTEITTYFSRMTSKLSFWTFEWHYYMKQKKICWKECNFTFAKLKFLTHTWRDSITLPWGDTEILFLGNCIDGINHVKQRKFICNLCNFIFVKSNTFNTHMERQRCLTLGRQTITIFGQLMKPTIWNKGKLNAINAILHL